MRKQTNRRPIIAVHLLFVLLLLSLYLPGLRKQTTQPYMMTLACVAVEALVCISILRSTNARAAGDIGAGVFALLLIWQVYTTRLGLGHIILMPTPEAVFQVFYDARARMIAGIVSSLSLLGVGFLIALPAGTVLGLFAGWNARLRNAFVPIARALSPVPAIIYAPYLIAAMPTFRSASAAVLVIGIFWPTFLQMTARVTSLDKGLIDAAKVLGLRQREMLFEVLLPYVAPGMLVGLRSSLSSAFMLLTLAEMMGASSGLGYFIKNFADYADYAKVVAGILLVAIIITLLNRLLSVIERHIVRC